MSDANDTTPVGDESPAPGSPAQESTVAESAARNDEHAAPPRGVRVMAVARWMLVAAMASVAATSIAYWAGWLESESDADAVTEPYICPMHPAIVQDHPGDCPICSMSLVQRSAEAGDSRAADEASAQSAHMAAPVKGLVPIDLTPERIQLAGLRTARAERATLAPQLRAVGTVSATENGLAQIHTRVAGWIEELLVEETGQRIKKGQVLARLYSPELLAAQQEFLTAQRWAATPEDAPATNPLGPRLAEDARHRLELLGVSSAEIDEIAKSGRPVRAVAIRSLAAGHITRKNVVQGQYVQPGSALFEVADLTKVWMLADVPEQEMERVRVGAPARIALAAFPARHFEGHVEFVYPTVAQDTRTVTLRVALDNADLALRPGMYGDVYVEVPAVEAFVVPTEAVVDIGTVQYVFVALAGGRFEPRRVKLGLTAGDSIQVLAGIAEGETVVTTGNFLIDSESRLQAAISGGASQGEDEPAELVQPAAAETPAAGSATAVVPSKPAPAGAAAPSAASASAPAPRAAAPSRPASPCDREFDRQKYPDKHRQCLACEVQHRGMGSMVDDCKRVIAKPWR